jgi:hypothetical protein
VDHHHCLEGMAIVSAQPGSYFRRGSAPPPVARHIVDLNSEALRELPPELRKMPRLKHQHTIAGRKGIDDRCFPRTRTRGRIDHHGTRGLKDGAQIFQNLGAQLCKLRPR